MAHFERMESSPTPPPNSSTVGPIPDIIERRTQVLRSAAKLSRSISTRIKATAGSILPNGSSSESPSSSSKFASTSFSPSGRDSSILVASSTSTGTGTGTGSSPPTSGKGKGKDKNNKDKYPVYTSPTIKKSPPSVTSSIKHITSSFSLTRHGRSKSDTASSSSPFAIMPAAAESLLSPTTQTSRPQFDHPSGLGSGGGPPVSGNPIAESGSEGGGGGGGSNSIVRRRSFRHEQYPRSQQDHHHQPVSPPPRLVKAAGHDITSDASVDEAELKVPALLQTGTPMLKVSSKQLKMRMFRLDPDLGQVIWESNRYGVLPIEHIKEIRTGPETSYHREQLRLSADYEPRWISLVYARDGKYKILHMVSLSDDVFRMWNVILRKLFSLRQELMSGLGDANAEVRQRVWEKLYWKGADSTGDAKLDFQEVERMCRRLNIATPRSELLNCFMQADSQSRGFLDFADFRHFVKLLRARPDIAAIYDDAMGDSPEFTFEVFERFMRESQKSTLSKEELLRIYAKYGRPRYISMPNTPLVMPAEIKGEDELPGGGEEEAVRDGTNDQQRDETPVPVSAASPVTSLAAAVLATASTLAPKLLAAPELTARQTKLPGAPHELPGESIKFSGDISATVVCPTDIDPTPTEPPPTTIPPTPTPDSPTPPWSLSTFEAFLHSTDNSPFGDNPDDMTRPLSEYYISASHNTYLVGHQLVGDSTIEGYIRALLHGCRSVELDIWDGDDGPAIFHGHTLTTKVSLQDVVRAIARYAFVASPYPVVISAEIHCCLEQQDMAAEIMRKEFGSALVDEPVNGEEKGNIVTLPSPEALKGRILFKAKNAFLTTTLTAEPEEAREGGVDVDVLTTTTEEVSSSDVEQKKGLGKEVKEEISHEVSRAKGLMRRMRGKLKGRSTKSSGGDGGGGGGGGNVEKPKPKMSLALAALLVYTVGIKCRGLNKKETYAVEHVFSLSERMADKVMRESMADLIKHNRTHVIRVYPSGTRLSSTNYEPHRYWASGAQLVAINFQTFDLGYIMNYAMFMRNGRLGYVLKPAALRLKDKQMASRRTKHFLDVTIISAQQLPHPKEGSQGRDIDTKRTIDPYVEVSLHVPEWSISPFLPDQNARRSSPPHNGSSSSSSSNPSSARTVSYVTSVVKDNGFNPVWKETMAIPFDCVGDMRELIFVRFQVKDEHGHDDLGVYCVSLASLLPGYRHLPLHDKQMSQYLFSTLFIHTIIRDVTD